MHELESFMRQVEDELSSEYKRISSRVTEDPGTAGDEGEENWAGLLRKWLPSSYEVRTKGRILSVDGEASPQVDVLVLKPSYPPGLRDKKYYLAGGVAAAFECKMSLKKSHIAQAIETAREVQRLAHPKPPRSSRLGSPYQELHGPLVYGLLAHDHVWHPGKANQHITEALDVGVQSAEHPRDVLDLVCVSNLATWSTTRIGYSGPNRSTWHLDSLRNVYVDGYASCVTSGPPDPSNWGNQHGQFPEIPFAQMCSFLMSRLAWEDPSLRSIAEFFRVTGLGGRSEGRLRSWDLSKVYSQGVVSELWRGHYDTSLWSI